MTKWQEFPIRPQGRPWSGINTRSGKLDDGTGQMTDSSVNVIINRADKLEKRKGMIRGIDERFAGAICGLHKYTDECGREWLLVADQEAFSIRQPFAIPSFKSSDAYPSDSFQADGPVNPNWWNNRGLYTQLDGSLVLVPGALDGGQLAWFKPASNFSYKVFMSWTIEAASSVIATIKQGSTGARIEGRITAGQSFTLVWIDVSGSETQLAQAATIPVLSGSLELSYSRDSVDNIYGATMDVSLEGTPTFRLENHTTLNALNDAGLGQGTAFRITRDTADLNPQIHEVQGGPL